MTPGLAKRLVDLTLVRVVVKKTPGVEEEAHAAPSVEVLIENALNLAFAGINEETDVAKSAIATRIIRRMCCILNLMMLIS